MKDGGVDRLPAPGDRAGDLPQLQERAAVRAPEAAVRDRAGRQVVPQRDHARATSSSARSSSSRWRWSSSCRPTRRERWYEYWLHERIEWYERLGHPPRPPAPARARRRTSCRTTPRGTSDVEYLFPIGWSELEGIANRGDFDLTQHAEHSGQKLEYKDPQTRRALRPARDRARRRRRARRARVPVRRLRRGRDRRRAAHRAAPAPARSRRSRSRCCRCCARTATPSSRARSTSRCAAASPAEYDEGGAIGSRYRRQDEIGTPFARHDRPPVARGRHGDAARPRLARAGARARSTSCPASCASGSAGAWRSPKSRRSGSVLGTGQRAGRAGGGDAGRLRLERPCPPRARARHSGADEIEAPEDREAARHLALALVTIDGGQGERDLTPWSSRRPSR